VDKNPKSTISWLCNFKNFLISLNSTFSTKNRNGNAIIIATLLDSPKDLALSSGPAT
jgi:hypothetical protein